ncbi:hypothetical protein K5M49_25135, partial [Serratia marcescens]|nr:hypothetical protein [Serratia marcescens]
MRENDKAFLAIGANLIMPCGKAVSGQLNGEHSKSARLNGLAYKAGEDFNLLSLAAWCCLSRRNINQLFYNEWCFHYFNS